MCFYSSPQDLVNQILELKDNEEKINKISKMEKVDISKYLTTN